MFSKKEIERAVVRFNDFTERNKMGVVILLLSIAAMFASFFRTRFSIGLIAFGMFADVLAFLNLFIPAAEKTQTGLMFAVAAACGLTFIALFVLLAREWKKIVSPK